jgi:hypothetical protein
MDRVGRVALFIAVALAASNAAAGEQATPERVFPVTTADWTTGADGSSGILLTQAGG